MESKNILLIIPELGIGGAQRSLSNLSLEFSQTHQVYVVVFNKDHKVEYAYGGSLLSLDVFPGAGIINKLAAFIKRTIRLRRLKKKLNIDVSVSFLEGADYVNILSRTKDRVVVCIRGSKRYDETIARSYYFIRNKILIPWLYRKAEVIVTVNKGIVAELNKYYGLNGANIVTINNFYNSEEIQALSKVRKPLNVEELYNYSVLVTSGRLAPEKGLDSIIKVFCTVKKLRPDVKLLIVGNGPCHNDLVNLCRELNLVVETDLDFAAKPDVLFLGNQSNVFKYLNGATLYLMNSSSEGFPNGLVEAMICQVPIISSDCPYGPREILAPNFQFKNSVTEPLVLPYGVLMPIIRSDEDEKSWAGLLLEILENRKMLLDLKEQASQRVTFFDKKFIMSQWQKVLMH